MCIAQMNLNNKAANTLWWRQCDWLTYFPKSILDAINFMTTGKPVLKTRDEVLREWKSETIIKRSDISKPKTRKQRSRKKPAKQRTE